MEIKPNVVAMEILAYLASETVAQVRVQTCHVSPYVAVLCLHALHPRPVLTPPASLPGLRAAITSAPRQSCSFLRFNSVMFLRILSSGGF